MNILCIDRCGRIVKPVRSKGIIRWYAVRCGKCARSFELEVLRNDCGYKQHLRAERSVPDTRFTQGRKRIVNSRNKNVDYDTAEEIERVKEQRINLYQARVIRGEMISLPPQTELAVMKALLKPGDRVRINTPENPRLHNTDAEVVTVHDWGCLLNADAAATGQFRATWDEIRVLGDKKIIYHEETNPPKSQSQSGNFCPTCGGLMVRTGTCETCQSCGNTSGGCS